AMVWENRKRMGIIVGIAFICSVVVSFILPNKYRATTVLFAAYGNNPGHALLSGMPDEKDYLTFGEGKACEQLAQVLNSETVMRIMMKKYDLMKHYKIAPDEPGKYALLRYYYSESFNFDLTEYESIKIDVYDKSPEDAAEFANGVVKVTDSVYSSIVKQRAVAAFNLVKEEYDSANRVLNVLEDSMNFYRKMGLLNYLVQVKELTRGYSDAIVKGSPTNVQQMKDEIKPFEQYGKGFDYLYNQLLDHYKWMQQLKESYIETKTNAEKTLPPFYTVEKAIVPDKKVYPVRWLVVVGGTFAGFFIGLFLMLLLKRLSPSK